MALTSSDFELLLQANRILSSKLVVSDVLQAVMELATKLVRAEASSLFLLDEEKKELYVDVALGAVKDKVKRIRVKMGDGVVGWVADQRTTVVVNDVTRDTRFTNKVDKQTAFQTRSILAAPVISRGKLIGVVEAINKENLGQFTPQDREAFDIFATQVAVAIENARLFSSLMEERERMAEVIERVVGGIVLLNDDARVTFCAASAARNLGFETSQQTVGKAFGDELFCHYESTPSLDRLRFSKDMAASLILKPRERVALPMNVLVRKLGEKGGGYVAVLNPA